MAVKKAPKAPKYTIANTTRLMRMLAQGVRRDAAPDLPAGCTHAIFHKEGEMDGLYAAWPATADATDYKEEEVDARGADVVFTDAWGVKCIKDHMNAHDRDEYTFLQLRSTPQEIDTDKKRIPKERNPKPAGQTDLGLISDAIMGNSRVTATGKPKDVRPTEERTKLKPAAFFTKGKPPKGNKAMACINDNGRLLKWKAKTAGYWRQTVNYKADDTLPFPVVTTAKGYNKSAFLKQLEIAEMAASRTNYRGWSSNRWDGTSNGSSEYNLNGWTWPSGYETYLKAGVLPSREFYKFIMGKDLKSLPSYN